MRPKTAFIIIATVLCGLSLWSGVFRVDFNKNDSSGSSLILKIEKNSKGGQAVEEYYTKTSEVLRNVSEAAFIRINGPSMVERYKEQPMLYGLLAIFSGASICIAGFVIHILRGDPRFQ